MSNPYGNYYEDHESRESLCAHDEPVTVRCVCGAVVNKDDATRADDDESWLCKDCAEWIAAVCK